MAAFVFCHGLSRLQHSNHSTRVNHTVAIKGYVGVPSGQGGLLNTVVGQRLPCSAAPRNTDEGNALAFEHPGKGGSSCHADGTHALC